MSPRRSGRRRIGGARGGWRASSTSVSSSPRKRLSYEWGALDHPAASVEAGLVARVPRSPRRGERTWPTSANSSIELAAPPGSRSPCPGRARAASRRSASGRAIRALEVAARSLKSLTVRAGDLEPDRDAPAFADEPSVSSPFSLSVGFGPVAAPPSGAFPIAPSQHSHSHSIPFACSSSQLAARTPRTPPPHPLLRRAPNSRNRSRSR